MKLLFAAQPFEQPFEQPQLLSENSRASSKKKNSRLVGSLQLLPESSRRIKKKNNKLEESKLPQVLQPLLPF